MSGLMSGASHPADAPSVRMDLWRLELARLVRTNRWLVVVGIYAFFGVVGPVSARYIDELIRRFGGGVEIVTPDPQPVDGIVQFIGNASQLGLLAVVVVAASALALDAKPEVAAFLRTKVAHAGRLLVPRYVASAALAAVALVVGTAVAWALTAALIGPLPAGAVLLGTLLGVLYLAFAVAVVALVAGYVRSTATTVFGSLGVLLVLPVLGLVAPLRPWLPSELLGAVGALVAGADGGSYARSAAVAVVATAALLALAIRRVEAREPA